MSNRPLSGTEQAGNTARLAAIRDNPTRMAREGFQATNTRITTSNSGGALAVGTVLGAIGPGLGQAFYVTTVSLSSDIEVLVHLQRGNANLIANAASPGISPVKVGPGRTTFVDISDYIREKERIPLTSRRAFSRSA
jgi:hypothetical protein